MPTEDPNYQDGNLNRSASSELSVHTVEDEDRPSPGLSSEQFRAFLDRALPQRDNGSKKLSILTSTKDIEWKTWRLNFHIVSRINGWNDLRSRREAASALEGAAKRAVSDIDHETIGDIQGLLDAYEERFVTQASSDLTRVTFMRSAQEHDESILAWHTRVRDYFLQAYPHTLTHTNRTLIDQFILGLQDIKIIEYVWDFKPATFSEALRAANNKAASIAVVNSRRNPSSTGASSSHPQTPVQAPLPGGVRIKTEPGVHSLETTTPPGCDTPPTCLCAMDLRSPQQRFPTSSAVPPTSSSACWNCQRLGHYKRECPQKPNYPLQRTSYPQSVLGPRTPGPPSYRSRYPSFPQSRSRPPQYKAPPPPFRNQRVAALALEHHPETYSESEHVPQHSPHEEFRPLEHVEDHPEPNLSPFPYEENHHEEYEHLHPYQDKDKSSAVPMGN